MKKDDSLLVEGAEIEADPGFQGTQFAPIAHRSSRCRQYSPDSQPIQAIAIPTITSKSTPNAFQFPFNPSPHDPDQTVSKLPTADARREFRLIFSASLRWFHYLISIPQN